MQHTTKAANSPSTKTKKKKTDGYLLYNSIVCHRVSTKLQDFPGEEKIIKVKATKNLPEVYFASKLVMSSVEAQFMS